MSYVLSVSGQMLVRESAQGDQVDQEVLVNRIRSLQTSLESSRFIVDAKPPKISWNTLKEGLNVLPFNINLVVDPGQAPLNSMFKKNPIFVSLLAVCLLVFGALAF